MVYRHLTLEKNPVIFVHLEACAINRSPSFFFLVFWVGTIQIIFTTTHININIILRYISIRHVKFQCKPVGNENIKYLTCVHNLKWKIKVQSDKLIRVVEYNMYYTLYIVDNNIKHIPTADALMWQLFSIIEHDKWQWRCLYLEKIFIKKHVLKKKLFTYKCNQNLLGAHYYTTSVVPGLLI